MRTPEVPLVDGGAVLKRRCERKVVVRVWKSTVEYGQVGLLKQCDVTTLGSQAVRRT
jgi:hypothetical protein